jgi:hypothetical protein
MAFLTEKHVGNNKVSDLSFPLWFLSTTIWSPDQAFSLSPAESPITTEKGNLQKLYDNQPGVNLQKLDLVKLQVPQCENSDGAFFTSINGLKQKMFFYYHFGPDFDGFIAKFLCSNKCFVS